MDYKLFAINYYEKVKSIRKVCSVFECSKSSLHGWLNRYFETGDVSKKKYKNRKKIITEDHLEFLKKTIKKNPSLTLNEINILLLENKKVKISISYLFYIIKYKLNITHKQLRLKYYPEKKLETLKFDKKEFYKKIVKKGIKNIISIDETAFYLNMDRNFGRCIKGKRCYKTIHKYPYVKFNFVCAIKYGKVVGYKLYQKNTGGIDKEKFKAFYDEFINGKYKNYLIILDNAQFHRSKELQDHINKKNKIIYSLPYNPNLNPIENFFSQLKSHIKGKSPDSYESLNDEIKRIIKHKISKIHLKNYFKYLLVQEEHFIQNK